MKRDSLTILLSILAAWTLDSAAGPILWGRWTDLHFVAATVALWGMKRGPWYGLVAGWTAALIGLAVSDDPAGLAMVSLGATGFAAGFLVEAASLLIPWLDALLLFSAISAEHVLSSLIAWMAFGEVPHVGLGGLIFTALAMTLAIGGWRSFRASRYRRGAR